jgi:hypothetical protein
MFVSNAPGWYGAGFALPGKFFCSDQTTDPVKIDPDSIEHVGLFTTGDGNLRDWQEYVDFGHQGRFAPVGR